MADDKKADKKAADKKAADKKAAKPDKGAAAPAKEKPAKDKAAKGAAPAEIAQHVATVVLCLEVTGRERECALGARERFVEPAELA